MSKRKMVAILTQALGYNYGGIIQNYALQKVVRDLGCNVTTIDRSEENPHSEFKIAVSEYKTIFQRHFLKQNKLSVLDRAKVSKNTKKFIEKHIQVSAKIRTSEGLKKHFARSNYDFVIVGSDQVWRPKYSPNIFNFFLDFLSENTKIKKLSYAASFGTEDWEFSAEETEKCESLIQLFDAVSVRENSGVKLCKDFLNRNDALHVLDPTLLLQAEDYSQLIARNKEKIGLFTYVLDDEQQKTTFIHSCAKQLGLSIHTNQAKQSMQCLTIENIDDCTLPPLEGWLRGFRDAEFVITDSFHGTVFSIINQKPFFVLVNADRGASRFESLLGELGLLDRLIYNTSTFDFNQLNAPINYKAVTHKLDSLKMESLQFLKENLSC